jgi:hypothetical protein
MDMSLVERCERPAGGGRAETAGGTPRTPDPWAHGAILRCVPRSC